MIDEESLQIKQLRVILKKPSDERSNKDIEYIYEQIQNFTFIKDILKAHGIPTVTAILKCMHRKDSISGEILTKIGLMLIKEN